MVYQERFLGLETEIMTLCNRLVYGSPSHMDKLSSPETNEDRISNLPKDIICHILSRLPTMRAVETCILSRDWKYKWTSMYHVCLDDPCKFLQGGVKDPSFTHDSRIRTFHMFCGNHSDPQQISTWISTVLKHGVQNLVVDSFKAPSVFLRRCLADCTSLTSLKLSLRSCTLEVPVENCFSNLKSLYLRGTLQVTHISNHQSHNAGHLFLKFPVLQFLELENCKFDNVKSVEIQAPELLMFKAHTSLPNMDLNHYAIKIRGPKLAKFYTFGGNLGIFDLSVPSIYYVDLHNVTSELDILACRAKAILKGASGLACLRLGELVVQALLKLRRRLVLPTMDRLKRLELEYSLNDKIFLVLLEMMPNLEYLNIAFGSYVKYQRQNEQNEPLAPCIVFHLKEVKCINFHGERNELDLINLFLENAKKLERVFVYPARNSYSEISARLLCSRSACVTIFERPSATSFEEEASLEAKTRSNYI